MKNLIPLILLALVGCGGGGSDYPAPATTATAQTSFIRGKSAAYGDSTQAAQGQPHAASRPGRPVVNEGVSGTTAHQLFNATDRKHAPWWQEMERSDAELIIVNHGLNHSGDTTAQYTAIMRKLADGARSAGKKFMFEEPNPAGPGIHADGFDSAKHDERRAALRDLASHMGVYFCAQPAVPLADGIHPTADGYATKAGRLAKCIEEVLS